MKFAFKILTVLGVFVLNFVIYVLVFLSALGIKPGISRAYAKYKVSQAVAGLQNHKLVMQTERQVEIPDSLKKVIEVAHRKISKEESYLQRQKDSLSSEQARLAALKEEIAELLKRKKEADEQKLVELARLYDKMDQQKVAEVFSHMSDSLVVKILPRMKAGNASQVLEYLPSDRSAKISRMLLEGKRIDTANL